MARIEMAAEVHDDFDRFFEHLQEHDIDGAARLEEINQAISVLKFNPLIGRPVRDDKRELIIGRRTKGYVALYRYEAEFDTVFILAIRAQREASYNH